MGDTAERGLLTPLLGSGLGLVILRSFATPIGLGALAALARASLATVSSSALEPGRTQHFQRVRTTLRTWSSLLALGAVLVALVRPWSILPTHVALTALVVTCSFRDHVLAPLLEHRLVRHVGAVSYGIYLLNVPIVTAAGA